MRRVVITGISQVCSLGDDHREVFKNLCEKKKVVQSIVKDNPQKEKLKTSFYVPYPEFDDSKYAVRLKQVKARGSRSAYTACYSSLKALEDAGIENPDSDTRVFIGVGAPNMYEFAEQTLSLEHRNKISSMLIPMTMQSSVAAWVSIVLGIHGKSSVISMACASGTESVGQGYESILSGKCEMALCGGSDYLSDVNMMIPRGFECLKCVSTNESGISYPFSNERSCFLFSEGGAAIVVLEELEHAKKRNARIYAEVTGFECSSDGYSIISMYEDGHIIASMLKRLIGNKKVDYYNAHGTATKLNDEVEANVIRELFGNADTQPAISATKSLIGHTLGASGTIEIGVCADTINSGLVHGSTCGTIMENLNITSETRSLKVDRAVSASFGFGGHNAAVMLERFED